MKIAIYNILPDDAQSVVDTMERRFTRDLGDSIAVETLQARITEKKVDKAAFNAALKVLKDEKLVELKKEKGVDTVCRLWE